jgi:predicted nucleic acid-binding protein
LTTDLRDALRRRKPERRRAQLTPRPAGELIGVADFVSSGRALLLPDTNVYIGDVAGKLPAQVQSLIDRALLFHCSVCLSELATGVANADPSAAGWPQIRDYYAEFFDNIPATRLLNPDTQIWTEAGLVAGTLARTQGFQVHQRKECLNDALIYLTAAKAGLPVLTANREEFDLIQQIVPEGQFVYF